MRQLRVKVFCGRIIMESTKRRKLEAAGWKVGSVADFLELSSEEVAIVEIKLSLRVQRF